MKKSKFVLCFRPPLVIETKENIDDHSSASSDCKDIIVAKKVEKNNGKLPPTLMMSPPPPPPLLKNNGAVRIPSSGRTRTRKGSRKTLSKVLKTMLLDPPARIKGETIREIMTSQERTNDLEQKKTSLEKIEDHKRKNSGCDITIEEDNSTKKIPSNFSSSSSSSSCSCQKEKKKAKITKTKDEKPKGCSLFSKLSSSDYCLDEDMVLLYWVVLASLATIFLGKIFAILLATLWFYVMPCRSATTGCLSPIQPENILLNPSPEIFETPSTTTREFIKKKVIMDGLLQRPQKALNLLTV
ncbi:OLC1v1025123C1 [Oldenlandia corymbosa var. corymbosa]|uniref:OLC1v1025123C1 n=1 Tax=Oldenlandia corymbosa var. corymbosa TaxID=529605 RepID=A0AAV1C650_OLDCO|nr:OLC1v1025123C1 [Oldenlandia corymbosa var. corymbosa]